MRPTGGRFDGSRAAIPDAKPYNLGRCTSQNGKFGHVFVFGNDDKAMGSCVKPDFRVGSTFEPKQPSVATFGVEIGQFGAKLVRKM
jgi:hypothetical protein